MSEVKDGLASLLSRAETIDSYEPTLRDRLRSAVIGGGSFLGMDRGKAASFGGKVMGGPGQIGLADFVPVLSNAMGMEEGLADYERGIETRDPVTTVFGAGEFVLNSLPGGKFISRAGRGAGEDLLGMTSRRGPLYPTTRKLEDDTTNYANQTNAASAPPPKRVAPKVDEAGRVAAADSRVRFDNPYPSSLRLVRVAPPPNKTLLDSGKPRGGQATYDPVRGVAREMPGKRQGNAYRLDPNSVGDSTPGEEWVEVPKPVLDRLGLDLSHFRDPKSRVSPDGKAVYVAVGPDSKRLSGAWESAALFDKKSAKTLPLSEPVVMPTDSMLEFKSIQTPDRKTWEQLQAEARSANVPSSGPPRPPRKWPPE